MNKLQITIEKAIIAYNNGSNEQKQLLVDLFGQDVFKPTDVRKRIKTLQDACRELGEEHPFVQTYRRLFEIATCKDCMIDTFNIDVVAYLKLRIIVTALNERWTPKFEEGEQRYYPQFWICTNKQIKKISKKGKIKACSGVLQSGYNSHAVGGLAYANANYASSYSSTYYGGRLALKTEELAEYAGKQFIGIYQDFLI